MKKDKAYLQDMLDAVNDIERFMKGVSEKAFHADKEKQYAVIRAFEIIGEASKGISKELKVKYSTIPWRDIAGMRDKLIHMYFGVKIELIWGTIQHKIPELKKGIKTILKSTTF